MGLRDRQGDGDKAEELSGTRLLQLEFWKGFTEYLDQSNSSFNSRRAFPQNWYDLSIGTSRARISCTLLMSKSGRLGCELYLPGRHGAEAIFEALLAEKQGIEEELGRLDWQDLPDKKACRIADYKQPINLEDRDHWPELFAWLKERAEAFKATFADRAKSVDVPVAGGDASSSAAPEPAVGPAPLAGE